MFDAPALWLHLELSTHSKHTQSTHWCRVHRAYTGHKRQHGKVCERFSSPVDIRLMQMINSFIATLRFSVDNQSALSCLSHTTSSLDLLFYFFSPLVSLKKLNSSLNLTSVPPMVPSLQHLSLSDLYISAILISNSKSFS